MRWFRNSLDAPEQSELVRLAAKLDLELDDKLGGNGPDPDRDDAATRIGPSLLPLAQHPAALGASRCAEWIRRIAIEDRPFLLIYSCNEPHPPFVYPDPFVGMYAAEDVALPPTLHDPAGPDSLRRRYRSTLVSADQFSDAQVRRMRAAYYGGVSFVDHCFGLMLTALVETDIYDDTLVIFTSDHGEMLGHHGLFFKGAHMYDDMTRIPLVVRPPGGLGSVRLCDALVSHVDLVPTIAAWAGGAVEGLHGLDIGDLMRGDEGSPRAGVAAEYHSGLWQDPIAPLRMWRTGTWKYVESYLGDHELYDLQADPDEVRNLVHDADHAEIRESLRGDLREWLATTGDPWPDVPIPPPRPEAQ